MLAEAFAARAFGIEALEDALELLFRDAGALVLDRDLDRAARHPRLHMDMPARRAEGDRVAEQVAEDLHDAPFHPAHHHRAGGRFQHHDGVVLLARRLVKVGQGQEDRRDVHRRRDGAREFRIDARRIADVGDQPVHAHRILGDDGEEAVAAVGILDPAQRLERGAHRGQRVAQFVRDIGGEAFVRVDPRPERARRVLQVAREDADLVVAREQVVRHGLLAPLAFADALRRAREVEHGCRDGAREVEGQHHRQHQRRAEQHQHRGADLEQPRIHLPRVAREDHDAHALAAAARGLGDADQQPAIPGAPDIGPHPAFEGEAQLLAPFGAEVGLPVEIRRVGADIDRDAAAPAAAAQPAGEHGDQAVIDARDGRGQRAARLGRGQGLAHHHAAGAFAQAAVGDHLAGGVEQPGLGIGGGFDQAAQQRARHLGHQRRAVPVDAHRGFRDAAGIDARLGAQPFHLGRQQPVLVLVEIEQRGREQRRRHRVHQQDAAQQRGEAARARPRRRVDARGGGASARTVRHGRAQPLRPSSASPLRRVVRLPYSGSRCRRGSRSGRIRRPPGGTSCGCA